MTGDSQKFSNGCDILFKKAGICTYSEVMELPFEQLITSRYVLSKFQSSMIAMRKKTKDDDA